MEKLIRQLVSRHHLRLISIDISDFLGNIALVVASPHAKMRFVRDRGRNTCEIDRGSGGWEDDFLASSPEFSKIQDFCEFTEKVLCAKNL